MKLEDVSPLAWLYKERFVNEKGEPISFKEHPFLIDPYCDLSREQVFKKGAQVGVSVMMTLKAIFMAKTRGLNVIYTLPSDDDVYEFVPTKVDKITHANPELNNLLQTDKVETKQIGDRFIFFKGTRSKTAPIMTTADLLIHDEMDRSEQEIVKLYQSRVSRSQYKGRWILSNPSTAGNGVDVDWGRSDKKEWFFTCQHCGTEQTLTWENNVDIARRMFVCSSCTKEIQRTRGVWKPTGNGEISGWHMSQMMCPWITADELIKSLENNGREYFNNFCLGEPFDVSDIKISSKLITDLWTPKELEAGDYFLGVDSGKIKHYVLGTQEGLIKIGATEDWEDIEFLIKQYNPTTVIDALPDLTAPQQIMEKYPKVWLNYYRPTEGQVEISKYGEGENAGIVKTHRERAIDGLLDDMANGKMLISVPGEQLRPYISHWLTLRRIKEVNKDGIERYKWESSSGVDHWCHATVYYWIAKKHGQSDVFGDKIEQKRTFIIEKSGGSEVANLEDLLTPKDELIIG